MESHAVLIRANGEVAFPVYKDFAGLREEVSYKWFEVARRGRAGDPEERMVPVLMLCDEDGLTNTPHDTNVLASKIAEQHIVGDVFILCDGGEDLRGFTADELAIVRATMLETLSTMDSLEV